MMLKRKPACPLAGFNLYRITSISAILYFRTCFEFCCFSSKSYSMTTPSPTPQKSVKQTQSTLISVKTDLLFKQMVIKAE